MDVKNGNKPPNKYPGKQCSKPVADMTAEEYKQHVIYSHAVYAWNKANWSQERKSRAINSVVGQRTTKKYYQKHKEKIKAKGIAYRKNIKNDPVLFKEYKEKEIARSRKKKENLSNSYVIGIIKKSTKIPILLITQDMIDTHRSTLILKRLIKKYQAVIE